MASLAAPAGCLAAGGRGGAARLGARSWGAIMMGRLAGGPPLLPPSIWLSMLHLHSHFCSAGGWIRTPWGQSCIWMSRCMRPPHHI